MFWRRKTAFPHPLERALLLVLMVCSLTINVATRYCMITPAPAGVQKSISAHPEALKHQHLDKKAPAWGTPVSRPSVFQISTFYPRFAPSGPPVHTLFLENSLYNRPPPSAALFS